MKYKLVCDPDPEIFEEFINSLLEKGWKICGGAVVIIDGKQQVLAQGMIKEDENDRL